MPAPGSGRSFEKRFKFLIEINGITHAGFQKCSELATEIAVVEYYEGGSLIPNKSPGRVTVPNITLERGAVSSDTDLLNWFQEVVSVAANAGVVDYEYKRDLDIVVLDRDNAVLKRWRVTGAWPRRFVAGEWDNDSDDTQIEMVELAIDYFELV